jgi:NADH-quinone oxidoreductase subunit H
VGFIQRRPGPYEVGPSGLLQPLADALKLIGKQLVTPYGADKILFWIAPILSITPVLICFLPLPFGPVMTGMKMNLGIILILAFSGLNVLALCIGGWASNNKYSLLGAARAVSQSVAYEIPLLLTVLSVSFQTGSLDLSYIAEVQSKGILSWIVLTQPVAFVIFFISATAETNRAPFDLPEAESELTAGFHTEYSGMGFGIFFLAEYSYMVVICAVAVALFLGGYNGGYVGPFDNGFWWFLAKTMALILVLMWFRWTFPRVRFDQLLNVCWKWLIPLSLANLIATALVVKLVR